MTDGEAGRGVNCDRNGGARCHTPGSGSHPEAVVAGLDAWGNKHGDGVGIPRGGGEDVGRTSGRPQDDLVGADEVLAENTQEAAGLGTAIIDLVLEGDTEPAGERNSDCPGDGWDIRQTENLGEP
jgi:hypothetical protein